MLRSMGEVLTMVLLATMYNVREPTKGPELYELTIVAVTSNNTPP